MSAQIQVVLGGATYTFTPEEAREMYDALTDVFTKPVKFRKWRDSEAWAAVAKATIEEENKRWDDLVRRIRARSDEPGTR